MTEFGYAPGRVRTLSACLASAEKELRERPFDLADLVGETISAVEQHDQGWRLRCASGTSIIVRCGATFDPAGLAVIEP